MITDDMTAEKDLNKKPEINGYSKWNSNDPNMPHKITDCPGLLQAPLEIDRNRFKMDMHT